MEKFVGKTKEGVITIINTGCNMSENSRVVCCEERGKTIYITEADDVGRDVGFKG